MTYKGLLLIAMCIASVSAFAQKKQSCSLFWLPWISVNHLYGITGLEEFDPELYKQLIKE